MGARAAIVVAGVAFVAGLVSEHVRELWLQPLWIPLTDLAIGWVTVACGLVAAVARPHQPAGRRLVAAGFLWIVASPRQWFVATGRTDALLGLDGASFALVGWSDAVLGFIGLSFAARWPVKGRDRAMAVALVAASSFQTLVRLLRSAPDIAGIDLVRQDSIGPWLAIADISRIVMLVAAGVLILQRWRATSGPGRYYLGPVLLAGAAAAFAPVISIWYPIAQLWRLDPFPQDALIPLFWIGNAIRALVPVAMLMGILRQRGARAAVADAISQFGAVPSSWQLQSALARALGDPSLRVLTWDPDRATYLDTTLAPAALPASDEAQAATLVRTEGIPVAALVHDPALTQDPVLLEAGVAVTRLVVDNVRLNRELESQLTEVRASRARIVEAGDAERRRIERDLHDGVQQRLLALALAMRRAAGSARTHDPIAAEALERGADEALGVVEDVRRLAQGIHPTALSDVGLVAALRGLAARSPVPVDLELEIPEDVPPSVAAATYFVASEAMANIVKHAGATTIRLAASRRDGSIQISVEDDGRGGADAGGAGFRGLADRVAAAGGSLSVADRPAGGTIVTATIAIA